VFLADPAWREAERAVLHAHSKAAGSGERGWLMIPTGGAGGGLKFARHDAATLAAAVRGFTSHFAMERVNSLGLLPLHHVSGLMAWMRCVVTGGEYVPWSWREIEAGNLPARPLDDFCLSLVPTQLQRILASPSSIRWLRTLRVVFVGGGPAWEGLLDAAAGHGIPLSPCYGATETAAMVAALRPGEFLDGARGCGSPLAHARIEIAGGGQVRVTAESLFRGYFPDSRDERTWTTGDIGSFDARGSLVIHGRSDDVIVTGGEKVAPGEVEEALRSSGEFDDIAVIGLPDPDWGQVVAACHPPRVAAQDRSRIDAALAGLAPFKHPKRYVVVQAWPRNAQGKINRAEIRRLASGS
jgi:O-succinylbenzoic acid--CoA ligase